jgi:hypothetical protein
LSGEEGPDQAMPTSLLAIAKKAQERKDLRFFNLYRLIDESFLRDCWRDIRKNAASGVDGISAKEYGLPGFARPLSGATTARSATAQSSITATGFQFLMPDAEASISEEPGAGKRHAGICAGAVRVTGRPTAMT